MTDEVEPVGGAPNGDEVEPVGEVLDAEEAELDDDGQARLIRKSTRLEMHKSHEGPLPAPEDFERYDQVLPGAAERILALTESTIEHRQEMDVRHLNMVERLADRFVSAALVIGLAAIAAAFVIAVLLVVSGEAVWGAGIAFVDIIAAAIGLTRMMRRRPGPGPRDGDSDD